MSSRCSARVHSGFSSYTCSRGGKYQSADGKWYCSTHLPENKEKRQNLRKAAWDSEWALSNKRREADEKVAKMQDRLLFAIRFESEEEVIVRAGLWEKAIKEREVL